MELLSVGLDLLISILPLVITALVGAGGTVLVVWKFINIASGRIAKVATAVNIATKDNLLTGDEVNEIIDSFKGDLDGAKEAIRDKTIQAHNLKDL